MAGQDSLAADSVAVESFAAEPLVAGAFDTAALGLAPSRWLLLTGLTLLIGAVCCRLWVLPRAGAPAALGGWRATWPAAEQRLATFAAVAAAAAIAGAIVALVTQSDALGVPATVMLGATGWGRAWTALVVALTVAGGCALGARAGARSAWWGVALGAAAAAAAPAFMGHAAADPRWAAVSVIGDVVHVLAAGAWLGTLAAAALVATEARGIAAGERIGGVALLLRAFSPLALVAASLVAISGVVAAWLRLVASRPGTAWSTLSSSTLASAYGRTLALKLVLVAVVAGCGAINWRYVTQRLVGPRAAGSDAASEPRSMPLIAYLELCAAVLVLGATAVLVLTSPPGME